MQTRRLIAAAVIVVIVIALALLIKSCSSSATETALKNYNASVFHLINASDTTGAQVFHQLKSGNPGNVDLAPQVQAANRELSAAQGLSTPSQMASAQSALVSVMRLRAQAIQEIATRLPQAADKNTSQDAVYDISVGTSRLFGSDVLYKTVVAADIAKALNADGIPVGTAAGQQQINAGQIVQDLGWLQSTWIADAIGAQQSTAQANANNDLPGIHGHVLNFVTVDGTEIYSTSNNTIPANQAQTWKLNVTNGGQFAEYQVGCSVKIVGSGDVGTGTLPETRAGETTDCVVTLPSKPTPGTYTVVASISGVPGETTLTNNKITYSVTFN